MSFSIRLNLFSRTGVVGFKKSIMMLQNAALFGVYTNAKCANLMNGSVQQLALESRLCPTDTQTRGLSANEC